MQIFMFFIIFDETVTNNNFQRMEISNAYIFFVSSHPTYLSSQQGMVTLEEHERSNEEHNEVASSEFSAISFVFFLIYMKMSEQAASLLKQLKQTCTLIHAHTHT